MEKNLFIELLEDNGKVSNIRSSRNFFSHLKNNIPMMSNRLFTGLILPNVKVLRIDTSAMKGKGEIE